MRYWVISFILAFLPTLSFGAEGKNAKFAMSFELSPEIQAMMAESGGGQAGMASMVPEPMTGEMWWTDNNVRMDMVLPDMMSEEDFSSLIMLVDLPGKVMYMLNPTLMEAMEINLSDAGEGSGAGMMGMNPTEMTTNWMSNIDQLKNQPGTTVNELGKASVDGYSCLHYSFDVDPSQLEEPMPGDDEGLAGMLGAFGGEVWVVEETGVPIKLTTSIMGMDMTYKLTGLQAWTPTDSFFDVPEGYTILTMDDIMEDMATTGATED